MAASRYLPDPTSPWGLYVVVPTLSVAASVLLAIEVLRGAGGWPLILFAFAWAVAAGWNVYFWLFRLTYMLRLRGPRLLWYKPLKRGTAAVGEIVEIRTAGTVMKLVVISLVDGSKIVVRNHRRFDRFLDDLIAENDSIKVDLAEFQSPFADRHTIGGYLNEAVNNRWEKT